MSCIATSAPSIDIPVSCGTLIVNPARQLLLCHVTGMQHWDIPKGGRKGNESPLETAQRELYEETGLVFDVHLFEELGNFDFQKNKRLHLYQVRAPRTLMSLAHLTCTSYFPHPLTREPMPEMDGFRWASREEIASLCFLPLANRLLALEW